MLLELGHAAHNAREQCIDTNNLLANPPTCQCQERCAAARHLGEEVHTTTAIARPSNAACRLAVAHWAHSGATNSSSYASVPHRHSCVTRTRFHTDTRVSIVTGLTNQAVLFVVVLPPSPQSHWCLSSSWSCPLAGCPGTQQSRCPASQPRQPAARHEQCTSCRPSQQTAMP